MYQSPKFLVRAFGIVLRYTTVQFTFSKFSFMELSYFDITVPVFKKNLLIARGLLEKGLAHAEEKGLTEEAFLDQRLAPDMFPLVRQVQILTDNAKGATARLAGTDAPVIADTETTVAALVARIDTVVSFLDTFTPEHFAEAASRQITLPYLPNQYQTGADYLVDFALPNFFFHMSIIYALIRAQGVTIGKMDFLGSLKLHSLE